MHGRLDYQVELANIIDRGIRSLSLQLKVAQAFFIL